MQLKKWVSWVSLFALLAGLNGIVPLNRAEAAGTNIAPQASQIDVDSVHLSYTKEKAVDGNIGDVNSRWLSANVAGVHTYDLTWSSPRTINRVKVWSGTTYGNAPGFQIDAYTIQYWNSTTSTWVSTGASVTNNTQDGSLGQFNELTFSPVTTTKLRMNITGAAHSGDNIARLIELQVFDTSIASYEWNYTSSTEGWTANGAVSGLAQSGGRLNGTITGAASLYSPDNLNYDISSFQTIEISLKNSTSSTIGRLFFTTLSDTVFTGGKHIDLPLVANDTGYTVYTLNMANTGQWRGTLKQLRLDPALSVTSGSFSIEYIRIKDTPGVADPEFPLWKTELENTTHVTLSNYTVESEARASGGKRVKINNTANPATATFTFTGASGYYKINTRYYDQNNGLNNYGTIKLKQNGTEIDRWIQSYNDNDYHRRLNKDRWYIANGDTFVIEGNYNGGELGIVDAFELYFPNNARSLDHGYLVKDANNANWPQQLWTLDQTGGTIDGLASGDPGSAYFEPSMVLTDTSNSTGVSATRRFLDVTSGKVTIEAKLRFDSTSMAGAGFELLNDSTVLHRVKLSSGNLVADLSGGSTTTLLTGVSTTANIGLKVVSDVTAKTSDFYVNGALIASGVGFLDAGATKMNQIKLTTGTTGTGIMYQHGVRVSVGYLLNETFFPYGNSVTAVSDWTLGTAGGTATAALLYGANPQDTKSLKLDDVNTSAVTAEKSFASQTGNVTFNYKFYMPTKVDGMTMELLGGTTTAVKLVTDGGDLKFENSGGTKTLLISNYKAKVWYDVRIEANFSTKQAKILINGVDKSGGFVAFRNNTVTSLNKIKASTPATGTGAIYFDDLEVYAGFDVSSVPSPVVPSDYDSTTVGMQMFSQWVEGSQYGWKPNATFEDRSPMWRYWNDGDPEVIDWHIKDMLEHGIDVAFPYYSMGAKLYDGLYSIAKGDRIFDEALTKGFLHSSFAQHPDFRFAVQTYFVGSRIQNKAHLLEQYDYLIETFVKHPNYWVVDNKPVMMLFNGLEVYNALGSSEFISLLNTIETKLVNEGFAGAIFMDYEGHSGNYGTMASRGIDYFYDYWHGIYTSEFDQKTQIQNKRAAAQSAGADYLTTIMPSHMEETRDFERYFGGPTTAYDDLGFVTPGEYRNLLKWSRDTFNPSNTKSGSLGQSFVMLENWGEVHEGHGMRPQNRFGYDYLNYVREVFTTATTPLSHSPDVSKYDYMSPILW
ncbi:discoidin domain-containing protein [Paenibacillus koleovorans]|uniref:discoidin domain-containing protein n=1 Tax=Paenibacillus koleovorans TaxID=121608 RepID=UPI0013E2E432|nr:discoidin domain-containing protein [Paenibacillus koleovorans]